MSVYGQNQNQATEYSSSLNVSWINQSFLITTVPMVLLTHTLFTPHTPTPFQWAFGRKSKVQTKHQDQLKSRGLEYSGTRHSWGTEQSGQCSGTMTNMDYEPPSTFEQHVIICRPDNEALNALMLLSCDLSSLEQSRDTLIIWHLPCNVRTKSESLFLLKEFVFYLAYELHKWLYNYTQQCRGD